MQSISGAVSLCVLLFAVSAKAEDFPFYALISNTTAHNCSMMNSIGPNHAAASVTYPVQNKSMITFTDINQQGALNLTKAVIQITPSSNKMNVILMVTAIGADQNASIDLSNNDQHIWKPKSNGKGFKEILVKSSNFTGNATYVSTCIDTSLVYSGSNTTDDVIVMSLGCWTWNNGSTYPLQFKMPTKTINLTSWAIEINKNTCSGAFTSQNITPFFALLLSFVVYFFNKA